MAAILHVHVRTAYEAECAESGGADRLILSDTDGFSPPPDLVAKVRKASSVDLRVIARLREGYTTDGGEMTSLKGLVFSYVESGADGFVFGFLNSMSGIDVRACEELAGDDTWGWTFDRAIDAALDQDRAWEDLQTLPRLDSVMTAGSARGVEQGLDTLTRTHRKLPVIVAGDLSPEHIPWLVRGGLSRFYVDSAPVTAQSVRAWRMLIDEEWARQNGR